MNSVQTPPVSRWSDFLAVPETRSALRAVRGLARALLAGKRPPVVPLLLHGSPGTGKTHLIATLLRKLAEGAEVVTARSVAAGDVARAARVPTRETATPPSAGGTGSENDPGFADPELAACDLLALEDVQLLPLRAADPVCDLLDRRAARRRAGVVTANVGPAGGGAPPRGNTPPPPARAVG